jgi:hypothetical protein
MKPPLDPARWDQSRFLCAVLRLANVTTYAGTVTGLRRLFKHDPPLME